MNQEQMAIGEWIRKMSATSYRGWKAFYHTTRWKRKREHILRRDHHACVRCRQQGRYTRATTVHHVIHLRDNPCLALTDDNLVSLCTECHEAVHPEKHKDRRRGYKNLERW